MRRQTLFLATLFVLGSLLCSSTAQICGPGVDISALQDLFSQVKDFAASSSQSAIVRVDSIGYAWGSIVTEGLDEKLLAGGIRTLAAYEGVSCVIDERFQLECLGVERSSVVSEAPKSGFFGTVTIGNGFACALSFDPSFFNPDLSLRQKTCDYAAQAIASIEPVCWGSEYTGPSSNLDVTTAKSMVTTWDPIVQIWTGAQHTCFKTVFGNVFCGGRWTNNIGIPQRANVKDEYPLRGVALMSSGATSACFVMYSSQQVICRGGSGATVNPPGSDVQLKASLGSLAVGSRHACGIKTDGDVVCWGFGRTFFSKPPPDYGVYNLYSGPNAEHYCARKNSDGTLYCWGICNLSVRNRVCEPPIEASLTPCELVPFSSSGNCLKPLGISGPTADTEMCETKFCTIEGRRYQLFGDELCVSEITQTYEFVENTEDPSRVVCRTAEGVKLLLYEG